MRLRTAVNTCLHNIWKYRGRASRAEYWCCVFCYLLVACVAFGVILPLGALVPALIWLGIGLGGLAVMAFVPSLLAVSVRRLHDCNLRGWWLLAACALPYPLAIALGLLMDLPVDLIRAVLGGEDLPQVMVLAMYRPLQFCTLYLPEVLASLLMLYVTLRKGTPGPNRYGPDPLATPGEEAAYMPQP